MRRITTVILALLAVSASAVAEGAAYFVSPSGDDDNDGLSQESAWASIDNGDQRGILVPGDTVNVLPGEYTIAATVHLMTDATSEDRITYRNLGEGEVVLDMNDASGVLLLLDGTNVVVQGFEITGTRDKGIQVRADSCIVMDCYVHHTGKECFKVEGSECRFFRDIAAYSSAEGFRNEGGADNNRYYNNTVYGNNKHGFGLHEKNSLIINNVIVGNDHGIDGDVDNVCMYNDVWGNASDYAGGASDDGGSISADPLLVDPSGANFHLGYGSEAVDAGSDIGYPYTGEAPDMGAVESCPLAVRDEFNTQSYANNEGSRLWTGPWDEIGEIDGPDTGLVLVSDYAGCCPEPYCLRLGGSWDSGASNFGARREVNLTGATFAYLSYTYRRDPDDGYYASSPALVQVSGDGGVTWDTLQVISDGEDATCMPVLYNISAYISGSMQIRFITNSASSIAGYVCFDDIQVQFDGDCAPSTALIHVQVETVGGAAFGDTTLTTDNDTTRLYCRGYSESGDPLGDLPALWTILGEDSIGTVTPGPAAFTTLTLTRPGTGLVVATYDDSTADTTGIITCLAGDAVSVEVSPNTAVISSDSTLQFYFVSSDADGNPTVPQLIPEWRVFGGIGAISPTGLFTPTRLGDGRIIAKSGALADTTGIIRVIAGDIAYIKVTPDSVSVIEDKTVSFVAKAYDADSNFVAVITTLVGWSTTDPSGRITAQGVYTAGTDLSPPLYYVIATYSGFTDTSIVRVVSDGILKYIKVEWQDGRPVADTTLTTDNDTSTVCCRGYDSAGGLIGDQTVTWTVAGDAICDFYPAYAPSSTLHMHMAGLGRIVATRSASIKDTSGVITCVPGVVAGLDITPDSAVVATDSTLDFDCATVDADGNATAPQVAVEWSVLGGIGEIDSAGLFTPAAVGTGYVVAEGGGLADTTNAIVVVPGTLVILEIAPQTATVSADSTLQFTVSGFDAGGIPLDDLGVISWSVLGGIGSIDEDGLFTAVTAWQGQIRARSSLGPEALTDTITVVPGDVTYVDVVPSAQIVVEDSSFKFSAFGYDGDDNLVGDYSAEAEWSTSDPGGSVTGEGLYTAGGNPSPPVYYVTARLHLPLGALYYLADSSAVTVITSGALDHIRVEWADGRPAGDTTLTTDDDGTTFYCRGYDSGGNPIGDAAATWSLLGGDPIGSVVQGPGPRTRLTLTGPGSGRVRAGFAPGISDTTGLITCVAGAPAVLVVSPETATAAAGSSIQFTTSTYDADGNPARPLTTQAWAVAGGIGDVSGTGLFTATIVGTGAIACSGEGLADSSGPVVVVAGTLAAIEVSPDSVDVPLSATRKFTAAGTDAYGNEAATGSLTWAVLGGVGTIDGTGLFTGLVPGKGRVAATSDIGGASDTNRVVTVLSNNLAFLLVTPDTASVKISGSVQFVGSGFDAAYEPVDPGPLEWEVLGAIGTITSAGEFTAVTPGVGYVAARSPVTGAADTTNMIVVEVPTAAEIPIGDRIAHAGAPRVPLLAFRVSNAFNGAETLVGLTVRDASIGDGTGSQVRTNVDSLRLFVDANANLRLDAADTYIAGSEFSASITTIALPGYLIGPGSSRTFFVAGRMSGFPHDGDSLDLFLLPGLDIQTGDGTAVAGPDTINSLGRAVVDGLVAGQVTLTAPGVTAVSPEEGEFNALTIDIPRNGYSPDVLEIFSVFNSGSGDTLDIDSLVLYRDGGDGVWTGSAAETRIGKLSFTGGQWELSGIAAALAAQVNRFYLAGTLSEHPSDGATLSFGIPLHGLEMASANDGPIDVPVDPVGVISVVTSEVVTIRAIPLDGGYLVPGGSTGPLAAFELVNGYSHAVHVDEMVLTSFASDPSGAGQAEIDGQFGSVSLWLNRDGNPAVHGTADSLLASGAVSGGVITFNTNGLGMTAGGGVLRLFVETELLAGEARNANTLNFGLAHAADIDFGTSAAVSGTFPVKNPEDHIINIFPASQVGLYAVAGATLYGGDSDVLALDFTLPRNGYRDDNLKRLMVVNRGSTVDRDVLLNVRLYADGGDAGFDESDVLLGYFSLSDTVWDVSGLTYPLGEGENRFFISVDIAPGDFDGGTLRFEIPVGGVSYVSGTTGPDDSAVGNSEAHFVVPSNRITVISIPREAGTVRPGAVHAHALTFALYNGYAGETRRLTGIRLTNQTSSASDASFADFELGQVSLYYDSNLNRFFDDDSLLAAGYFNAGVLNISGLNISLAPESLSYFFVTCNVPLGVIDSDTLAVSVREHSDFTFASTVNLNGDLPLTRGGPLVIDGSVRRQYGLIPVAGRTLSPGDVSVPLFGFVPAANGDLPDTLTSLALVNDGDAGAADITTLRLWVDSDGDGEWDAGDHMAGALTYSEGRWAVDGLEIGVEAGSAPALFVTGNVAEAAAPNSSFRAKIPVNGCQYTSGNDGPVDAALVSEQRFMISSAGLRITYDLPRTTYSVGQEVNLNVRVTNILPSSLENVHCDAVVAGDSGVIQLEGVSGGPASVGSGETAVFEFDYSAISHGYAFWHLRAYSASQPESSATVTTEQIGVQTVPTGVTVEMVSSIPTAVSRGQSHVFPLSVKYTHSDASPFSAPIRLDSLRIAVEDGFGNSQAAGDVFNRMVLGAGYTNLAIVESPGPESRVLLEFSEPAVIYPGEEQILSLRVDIDSAATAAAFALSVEDESCLRFRDSNTGIDVPIDAAVHFPLKTASCAVNDPSKCLAVSHVPLLGEYANYGQDNVALMQIILRHYGAAGNSDIKFTALSFQLTDASGTPVAAGELAESLRLVAKQSVLGEISAFQPGATLLTMWLTSPLVVGPGQADTVKIEMSLISQSPHTGFGLTIPDSSMFTLRDLSSGSTVPAVADTAGGVLGPGFPMTSGFAHLRLPARSPEICLTSVLPASIVAGRDSVGLVALDLNYEALVDCSPLLLKSVRVAVLDTLGRPVDPRQLIDRTGVTVNGGPVAYATSIELTGGYTLFRLPGGLALEPGEAATVELIVDIEADAPYDNFLVSLNEAGAVDIVDGTDPTRAPGLEEAPGCEGFFPFQTGASSIYLPAGRPALGVSPVAARLGTPGQAGLTVFVGELAYETSAPQGDLVVERIVGDVLARAASGAAGVDAAEVFRAVHLLSGGEVVATDSVFAAGRVALVPDSDLVVSRGGTYVLTIACDLNASVAPGNYAIEFVDHTFMELSDRNLHTTIYPDASGAAFPLWSAEISVASDQLAASFTNYPNPFNPARGEETTIGFYLGRDARIDIEIFTITGELVKKVVSGSERSVGAHQEDVWSGLNSEGMGVFPGTYLCRITATYVSGEVETCRRKVMVIR